ETQRKEFDIRWLCFARVDQRVVSLHWQNFTAGTGTLFLDRNAHTGTFPYWRFVPDLFDEIATLTQTSFNEINFESLILDTIWDKYRDNHDNFKWEDIHIRAEHQ